jgi:glycerate 2-kinase
MVSESSRDGAVSSAPAVPFRYPPRQFPREAMKQIARHIFEYALRQSSIAEAFARHVSCQRGVLRVSEDLFDLNSYRQVFLIAIGKAAHRMLRAFEEQAGARFEGIVASSVAPDFHLRGFRYFQGGHPLPSAESIQAAGAMLKSVNALDESCLVIYLISGGGSAIAEKPIDDEISLADLVETYRVLVHSSAAIGEINTIRKHLSAIKGGRLAQAAYPAQQVSILVSDVPDGTPDALASGPTMPDSTTTEDCYRIAGQHCLIPPFENLQGWGARKYFPPSVRELFERHALKETPKSDDPAFMRARWWTILSNAALVEAAQKEAERQGFAVEIDNTCDDWDYMTAADHLLDGLRELRRKNQRGCLLSGGEITVGVENGGVGGRNQQFALYCAQKIAGENICVLSAGSDGIDGDSPAAGAISDGTTFERAKARGLDLKAHLDGFNAFPLFEALGDAILTGPTGNNLRDLRILLAY